MSAWNRAWAIAMLSLRPALRQPLLVVLVTIMPVSFVIVFRVVGGRELSHHALYGMLVVFATNVGIVSLPQLVATYRFWRLQDMFVASPVGPGTYACGLGLSRLLFASPALIGVTALLVALEAMPVTSLPVVLVATGASWFTGVMIGFTIATLVGTVQKVSMVANLAGMLISILPPVYYPLAMLSGVWQWVAMLVPTTHAAELIRVAGGATTTTDERLLLHWVALLLYCLVCFLVVARKARWRTR